MDWNTFQYIDVIAQTCSLTAAAKLLGINQSTLSRHLQKFEQSSGSRVFKRTGNKYTITAVGEAYVARARMMRQALEGVGQEQPALTLTSLDSFFARFLLKHVHECPQRIHFVSGNQNLDLARREADVAIRFGKPKKGDYVIKKIGRMGCAVYTHKRYEQIGSFETRDWVRLDDSFVHTDDGRWIVKHGFGALPLYTATSYTQIETLIEHTKCIGLLPCFMGDDHRSLRRFNSPSPCFHRDIWLILHRNLQSSRSLKELKFFLEEVFAKHKAALEG